MKNNKQKNKDKKRSSRNLSINSRIVLSSTLAIIIPFLIILTFTPLFLSTFASYFNFSSVTTNSYSVLNQIQWSQTLSSVTTELVSDDNNDKKTQNLKEFISPLEKLGCLIYIQQNDNEFYSTTNKKNIMKQADKIVKIDTEQNTNYFGESGLLIINHAKTEKDNYLVIIVSNQYTVYDVTQKYSAESISQLLLGKTGIIMAVVAMLFVLAIIILSLITSRTISKPIKKLAQGADEISNGNLDYKIEYDSTNEIGQTVKSFNNMAKKLKKSISHQNQIEKSRKEMIAGVAHDLRTPLTSIKGYVEGLRDGIADTPEKQDRYLKTIYSSTLDTEKMLNDLLNVSKLELGYIELHKETININDFFNDYSEELKFRLSKNDFDFIYSNNCEESVFVDLDTDQFDRVITNIVSNSIKYANKEIKGKIELNVENYAKSVIISISDNGIGLDSKNLNRIFESFYRADKARSKVHEGSGIGLSVCKQIVELHGGHIWATSIEGDGMNIFISLERNLGENNE